MYVQIGTEPICLDDVAAFPAGINVIHVHSKIKVSSVTDNRCTYASGLHA